MGKWKGQIGKGKVGKKNNFKSLEKKKMDMSQIRKLKVEDKKKILF